MNKLLKSDYYFELPPGLIAQSPLKERTDSKLMVLNKTTGAIEHKSFRDLKNYLKKGDCLVLNNTKVIPARLLGRKDSGGEVEILLLKRRSESDWECIVKPGRKMRVGVTAFFGEETAVLLEAQVLAVLENGNRIVRFIYDGIFEEILDKLGEMPLPPYITEKLRDKERYQTVYAKHEGSAAAPTAGLHFTKEFLAEIEELGVEIAYVTLHVGLGTFRPVKEQNILDHKMHEEYFEITGEGAEKINRAGRVIAVGTTSLRTIESSSDDKGIVSAASGATDIFIYPGYKFKCADCLITNFHLPESTLIMLVSAMAGREHVLAAYEEGVKSEYRFFSFGDAMFIQ